MKSLLFDEETQDIKENEILFFEKGRRGILRMVFGRTGIVILILLIQILVLFAVFQFLKSLIPYVFGTLLVFTFIMVVHVINTNQNTTVKMSWIILIMLIPGFGGILYLFIQQDFGHRAIKKRYKEVIEESVQEVIKQNELMKTLQVENKGLYNLVKYTENSGGFPIYENSPTKYFPLGEDAFEDMLIELEKAEKLEELGISCKMFAPIRPFLSTHYNYRDHRKITVVDGRIAFTGGINLADEYINKKEVYGHWKDTAIMISGMAVNSFTLMFLQMWNMNLNLDQRTYMTDIYESQTASIPSNGFILPFGDCPLDNDKVGQMVYMDILNRAESYVHIMNPYLIPDGEMVTSLQYAARRGVDVKILLPHIPDKKLVFAQTRSYYKELIKSGVEIYEYTPGFIHAKSFVSDDIKAVVGTINIDYRSLYHHFECGLYLEGASTVLDIEKDFKDTINKSQQVSLEDIKGYGFIMKIMGRILKLFAPLM